MARARGGTCTQGRMINGTCYCDPGFTGKDEFIHLLTDCSMHQKAITNMYAFALVFSVLALFHTGFLYFRHQRFSRHQSSSRHLLGAKFYRLLITYHILILFRIFTNLVLDYRQGEWQFMPSLLLGACISLSVNIISAAMNFFELSEGEGNKLPVTGTMFAWVGNALLIAAGNASNCVLETVHGVDDVIRFDVATLFMMFNCTVLVGSLLGCIYLITSRLLYLRASGPDHDDNSGGSNNVEADKGPEAPNLSGGPERLSGGPERLSGGPERGPERLSGGSERGPERLSGGPERGPSHARVMLVATTYQTRTLLIPLAALSVIVIAAVTLVALCVSVEQVAKQTYIPFSVVFIIFPGMAYQSIASLDQVPQSVILKKKMSSNNSQRRPLLVGPHHKKISRIPNAQMHQASVTASHPSYSTYLDDSVEIDESYKLDQEQ